MIRVYRNYELVPNFRLKTKENFDNLITETCRRENYGVYRYWEKDGMAYYDCGPVVFSVWIKELYSN